MHCHINHLACGIVHAHFGEAAIARFRIRLAFRPGDLRGLERLFHVLHLKTEMVDPFTPAACRQDRHIDVAVREIDRAIAVIAYRAAPSLVIPKVFL